MARTKFNIPGRGYLNSSATPGSWWLNIGIINSGQTLLNTRISVQGTGEQLYGEGVLYQFANVESIGTVGVTVLYGATDPGPPDTPPSTGLGVDWVLRDSFSLVTDFARPGNTATSGAFWWLTNANNPYVSRGMRLTPKDQTGYVYVGMDVWGGEAVGDGIDFGGPPNVVYNLLVLDSA